MSRFIEMFCNNKQTEKQGVLADFCTLKAGKSVKSGDISENYKEGLYPCYGGNGRRGYVSSFSHDGIYNIIGRQGALCGNVNIVNGKFYATEHAVVVTPKEQIAPHWLYFALSGMNLNQYARGVAQPGLAVNQLEQLPFTIPSMELQKQFVSIAHQADKSGFDGRKSRFIEMFGDPIKNSKNLPSIKGEELFVFSSGKANTKANLSKEFPYDCYGGNGITGKSEQWLIDFPTIIVGRVGEYCGCVHKTQGKIWITDNAIFIKEYKEKVFNGEFLFYLMTYLDFHRLADETGQPKITQRPLLSTEYMVPNLSLQEQFVSIAHQADKSGFELRKSIDAIDTVIKSLINS